MNELIKQIFIPVRVICAVILFVFTLGLIGVIINFDYEKFIIGN